MTASANYHMRETRHNNPCCVLIKNAIIYILLLYDTYTVYSDSNTAVLSVLYTYTGTAVVLMLYSRVYTVVIIKKKMELFRPWRSP